MRRSRLFPPLLMAAALLVAACSTKLEKQSGLSDSTLYSRGQQYLAKKKYKDAIEHYRVLLERFPNSSLAPKAQLGLADAYMGNGDDVEAEVAYDDFLRLYPANDNVPYALYRKGELLYRETGKPSRDQTKTREAIKAYKLLLEKSPSGPYAETAAKRVVELRNRLAEHEVFVVTHYLDRDKADSAEARARRALADYPDTPSVSALLTLLAEALEQQGKGEEAVAVRNRLQEKTPGSGGKNQ